MRGWSMDDVLEHVCGYAKTVLDLPILSVADEGNHCSSGNIVYLQKQ